MNLKQTFQNLRAAWRLATQRSVDPQSWLRGGDDDLRGGATLTSAYQQSVWVYSCIHTLAANVAQIPFRFSRGQRKGEDLITTVTTQFDGTFEAGPRGAGGGGPRG